MRQQIQRLHVPCAFDYYFWRKLGKLVAENPYYPPWPVLWMLRATCGAKRDELERHSNLNMNVYSAKKNHPKHPQYVRDGARIST